MERYVFVLASEDGRILEGDQLIARKVQQVIAKPPKPKQSAKGPSKQVMPQVEEPFQSKDKTELVEGIAKGASAIAEVAKATGGIAGEGSNEGTFIDEYGSEILTGIGSIAGTIVGGPAGAAIAIGAGIGGKLFSKE